MKKYSINSILSLSKKGVKPYLTSYNNDGYELGFGPSGLYEGHSHMFFTDILFSFDPIFTSDYKGSPVSGNLIIAPNSCYLGDVTISNFFFLKFCTLNTNVQFPEKVDSIISENKLVKGEKNISYNYDIYKTINHHERIHLVFNENALFIRIGSEEIEIHP